MSELCENCRIGYHAPFDRFQCVAVHRDGPTFLNACKLCGSLWHETLHDAKRLTACEARALYPSAKIPA
jgi:hypothetical protein